MSYLLMKCIPKLKPRLNLQSAVAHGSASRRNAGCRLRVQRHGAPPARADARDRRWQIITLGRNFRWSQAPVDSRTRAASGSGAFVIPALDQVGSPPLTLFYLESVQPQAQSTQNLCLRRLNRQPTSSLRDRLQPWLDILHNYISLDRGNGHTSLPHPESSPSPPSVIVTLGQPLSTVYRERAFFYAGVWPSSVSSNATPSCQ